MNTRVLKRETPRARHFSVLKRTFYKRKLGTLHNISNSMLFVFCLSSLALCIRKQKSIKLANANDFPQVVEHDCWKTRGVEVEPVACLASISIGFLCFSRSGR